MERNAIMKLLYTWTCVVVFISASNELTNSSTAAPPVSVTNESESFQNEIPFVQNITDEDTSGNITAQTSSPAKDNVVLILFEEKRDDGNTSPAPEEKGYVILMLILLLVLALCIILFYLRRVSRTYTFDLQRPAPGRVEPIGTFEPVYLDDLDYQVHTTEILPTAEANGTVLSTEDKTLNGEVSQTTDVQKTESSPTAETEPSKVQLNQDELTQDLNQDQVKQDQENPDELNQDLSPVLFIEESEEDMNVNNNNQSMRSSAFVEISLDEPQSSVQPFTFSSSELQHFYN
ncbi:hypothetical protein WMY93_014674 [Mugilogobius chulae]|uniref:Uncharacterized protein n=1 Tax=Mugilogobius chulae TaxID=88201 RepID=A0AAW0NZG7_9GOBI